MHLAVAVLVGLMKLRSTPEPQRACVGANADFDFWIGEWSIQQRILSRDGGWLTFPARTSVVRALQGCALVEQWQGDVQFFWEGMERPEALAGLSVRAYDPIKKQWAIYWMDTRTLNFGTPYVGGFQNGRGEFLRDATTATEGQRTRISFSDITDRNVTWTLQVSTDAGATWRTLWSMDMQRVGPSPKS